MAHCMALIRISNACYLATVEGALGVSQSVGVHPEMVPKRKNEK